jgi:hypothetical protein
MFQLQQSEWPVPSTRYCGHRKMCLGSFSSLSSACGRYFSALLRHKADWYTDHSLPGYPNGHRGLSHLFGDELAKLLRQHPSPRYFFPGMDTTAACGRAPIDLVSLSCRLWCGANVASVPTDSVYTTHWDGRGQTPSQRIVCLDSLFTWGRTTCSQHGSHGRLASMPKFAPQRGSCCCLAYPISAGWTYYPSSGGHLLQIPSIRWQHQRDQ